MACNSNENCIFCNVGMTLIDNECTDYPCDLPHCASCVKSENDFSCLLCHPGYTLDYTTFQCERCKTEGCAMCIGKSLSEAIKSD